MGRRFAILVLSGFLLLACDESSDSASDDGGDSSGAPSSGGAGGTSAGSPAGGDTSGGTGASGGASGGALAGMSGAGALGGCAIGGTGGGAGASEPAVWTCVKIDDLCECAHDPNGALPSCEAELNCCMTYLARNDCSIDERCFCQTATEEQCADAVERTEPIYMAVRTATCPP